MLKDILLDGQTEDLKSLCITATYHKKNERDFIKKGSGQMVQIGNIGTNAQVHRVYDPKGKSVTLSALGGGQGAKTGLYLVQMHQDARQKGAPLRTFKEKAPTIRANMGDNMPMVIVQKGRGFNKGGEHKEKSPTLTSSEWQHNNHLSNGSTLRKLHPIECERLQSLPDNYTKGLSNTRRYETLGNAFNVEVVKHILSHLIK